jgi:hypothetical protein
MLWVYSGLSFATVGVLHEAFKHIDEVGAVEGITANADETMRRQQGEVAAADRFKWLIESAQKDRKAAAALADANALQGATIAKQEWENEDLRKLCDELTGVVRSLSTAGRLAAEVTSTEKQAETIREMGVRP